MPVTQSYIPQSTTCPAPMTRAALLALATANGLNKDCDYVITDFASGTLAAGTLIHLQATSASDLSMNVSVNTLFDDVAWRGIYDIGTNGFLELEDNRGNRVTGSNAIITAFDWGNPNITGCTVENGNWIQTIGATHSRQNVKVIDSTLNTTGLNAGSNLQAVTLRNNASVSLATANTAASMVFTEFDAATFSKTDSTALLSLIQVSMTRGASVALGGTGSFIATRSIIQAGASITTNASSAVNITMTDSLLETASIINCAAASGGTLSINSSMITTTSTVTKLAAATAGSLSLVGVVLTGGSIIQQGNTGGGVVTTSRISSNSSISFNGTASLSISGCDLQISGITVNTSGAGNTIAQAALLSNSFITIGGTSANNNLQRFFMNHGTLNITNTDGIAATSFIATSITNGGVIGLTNNASNTVRVINTQVAGGNLNISNRTTLNTVSRCRIANSGTLQITTDYGDIAQCTISDGIVFASTAGGTVTRLTKMLSGALTLGGLAHTDIIHATTANTTLTAANTNRATFPVGGVLI